MIYKNFSDFLPKLSAKKRFICLDFGLKKIGVAISDGLARISIPLETIYRKNIKKDVAHINKIIKEFGITGIIIGYPIGMDGVEGANCHKVDQFASKILVLDLPILLYDERMTTKMANKMLIDASISKKTRKIIDDRIAASIILEDVLRLFNKIKES